MIEARAVRQPHIIAAVATMLDDVILPVTVEVVDLVGRREARTPDQGVIKAVAVREPHVAVLVAGTELDDVVLAVAVEVADLVVRCEACTPQAIVVEA